MINKKIYFSFIKPQLTLLIWALQILSAIAQSTLPEPILFPTPDFSEVYEIEQDGKGFLWLATEKGLFCFDGIIFRRIIHSPGGVSAVDNTRINSFFLDREEEKLWIATVEGASALDLRTESFTDYTFFQKDTLHLTDGECESIFKDREGVLWFGIKGLGLARLNNDTIISYPFIIEKHIKNSRSSVYLHIYQIAQDPKKESILWLATSYTGLIRFNTKTGRYSIPDQSKITEEIGKEDAGGLTYTSLFPSGEKIFLGNRWRNFCVVYNLKTRSFRKLETPEPIYINKIQYRSPTSVWVQGGIFILDIENDSLLQSFPKPDKVEGLMYGFLATPEQLWVSSNRGLLLYDFTTYQVENHIFPRDEPGKFRALNSILEKEDGTGFWVTFQGTDSLHYHDRKAKISQGLPTNKKEAYISNRLIRSQDGRILVTGSNGLYELRRKELIYLPLFEDLAASDIGIGALVQDGSGSLWLSTRWDGVYKLDLVTGQYHNYLDGEKYVETISIFKDRDDNIWMSYTGGFAVYHAQKDTVFHFPYQPGEQKTIHYSRGFTQDDEGNIWMSDIRVGGLMKVNLARLEEGIQQRFVAQGTSLNNQMKQLEIDRRGRIWAVTLDGLQVFDPKRKTFTLHGESAGFRLRTPDQRYYNFAPSYLTRLSTGEMLVGYHEGGFAIFHPDSLLGNKELPQPYLLSLKTGEKQLIKGVSFGKSENISLKHNQNLLAFEFSAIAWRETEKVSYAYRMKGVDDEWVETKQPSVNYTNLTPGAYTFQLHAINSDGKKLERPLEIHFEILPPWWRTVWAYALYLVMALVAAYSFYDYQRRQWQLRTQLAMEQKEAERLKELNDFKTRLYTNITHEFRTPLTVILGMAEQVRDKPKDWFREGLGLIIRNGKNLLNLVNQMLDLSKLESGTLPVNMIQGDIVNYLQYLIESFHSYAEARDIQLHFSCEEKVFYMDYDQDKLLKVVSNLLSNAIKYTPEGGDVYVSASISVRTQTFDPLLNNEMEILVLHVRDTGVGIAEDKLPFIFDRFYQVGDGYIGKAGGTGIGLALTKELVILLGGNIDVKSTFGEGSQFSIFLPVRRTAPRMENTDYLLEKEEIAPLPTTPSKGGEAKSAAGAFNEKPLLLIIEDNRDVVHYLSACLQEDYRLKVAFDGKNGIAKALELIPDVIISDVMMPKADGFEVCQTLKKDLLTNHIPIILLTAKADDASKIEGLEHGADAYLAKPFQKDELLVRLRKLLELRKRLQEHYRGISFPRDCKGQEIVIENAFIQEVQNILEDHLGDEHFGVAELSKTLGVSRAQLYRKFGALTGQTIAHYFRSMRLHKAKTLLQTTDLNISEIAFETGFKDPSYFTRTFKEKFGEKPSEVRR